MKKHFKILYCSALAGSLLFSAACSEAEVQPVEQVLEITVKEVSATSFKAEVTPTDTASTYYVGIIRADRFTDDGCLKLYDMQQFEEEAGDSGSALSEVIGSHLSKGAVTKEFNGLYPGLSYYVYAYYLDSDGYAKTPVDKEQCSMEGHGDFEIGDYYLADGTVLHRADLTDELKAHVVGVIFFKGNPAAEGHDSTLGAEHPYCVNGLAVALDTLYSVWSRNGGKFVNDWVKEDGRFMGVTGMSDDSKGEDISQAYNYIRGYNNTRAYEAYNVEASDFDRVCVMDVIAAYRDTVALPGNTSGWYLPSVKEVSLMTTGTFDNDLWNSNASSGPVPVAAPIINESFKQLGKVEIARFDNFSTSTEHSDIMAFSLFYNDSGCSCSGVNKVDNSLVRPVFAF